MDDLLNNYKAANAIDQFKKQYMDPLSAQVENARKIMTDDTYQWKSPEEKQKAKDKFLVIESRDIAYSFFYKEMKDIIRQHEELTTTISEIYMSWYTKISRKGVQPTEMMEMQAEVLQLIFVRLHHLLEPLKLNIPKPVMPFKE